MCKYLLFMVSRHSCYRGFAFAIRYFRNNCFPRVVYFSCNINVLNLYLAVNVDIPVIGGGGVQGIIYI